MGVPLYACELHNIVFVYIEVCRVIILEYLSEIKQEFRYTPLLQASNLRGASRLR